MTIEISIYPGAVGAGKTFSLPSYFPPLRALLRYVIKRKNSITWSGLGAAGATIATDDVSAAASGADTIAECITKKIVTTTPGTGEVQLSAEREITTGDAIADGDLVIIHGVKKTDYHIPT